MISKLVSAGVLAASFGNVLAAPAIGVTFDSKDLGSRAPRSPEDAACHGVSGKLACCPQNFLGLVHTGCVAPGFVPKTGDLSQTCRDEGMSAKCCVAGMVCTLLRFEYSWD